MSERINNDPCPVKPEQTCCWHMIDWQSMPPEVKCCHCETRHHTYMATDKAGPNCGEHAP